ncbi:MAG: MMPL family transporter [Thermoleophilia bacterium]|nr:MMPL family transporter [Thermoleophilia bacterium]
MSRWTALVLRWRWLVLALWVVAIGLGVAAARDLHRLTSNEFSVPGTDSERARVILQRRFGDRSDGSFLVVFRTRGPARVTPRLEAAIARGAAVVPGGRAQPLRAVDDVVYGSITSGLDLARAKGYADAVLRALRPPPGVRAYVTGQAAIQHDLDPIFSADLSKGESIALPIALVVLLLVFGLSAVVTMPLLFAAATIFGTLGVVWLAAHVLVMATYATNLVELIGLGIAIDYSLLVVYRYREELARGGSVEDAIRRTMATAGRAVVLSGATVAIGLALLLLLPVPFIRSLGVAGFFIPLFSIAGAVTLQPALLSLYGRRGVRRIPLLPARLRAEAETGFWHRLAGWIMRRPLAFLLAGAAVLLALAAPVFALRLTPGSIRGIPESPQSVRGFMLLTRAVGAGTVSPTQIVVDTGRRGGAAAPGVRAAARRLVGELRRDPEVVAVRTGSRWPYVDESRRYLQVVVAGRHEYGEAPAQSFVHRLRGTFVPGARFPAGVRVLAGGGPPQGVDFLRRAYGVFPWLVAGVLVLTYLLLARAFRSLVLPLKAVLLNLLSVAASYGMLVLAFRYGVGRDVLGLYRIDQVEGWIPIFLFAMLFGLSMDYEVFLVTRMRESWDAGRDNREAVAEGLERTGRIVTAAAVIMVAAFSAFVAGRIVGLQEFGLGLAVAILVDATLVRAVLVPSLMALLGRWNWWLPPPAARLLRVPPSPLRRPLPAVSAAAE